MSVVEFGGRDNGYDVEYVDLRGGFTLEESTSSIRLNEELDSDALATALIYVSEMGVAFDSALPYVQERIGVAALLLDALEQANMTALACFYDANLYDSVVA